MAHMKYNVWEKCPKCGASSPKKHLVDSETLRLTCWDCGHQMIRATLDSDGRQNIVDVVREATDKTRQRTIDRVYDVVSELKIKGATAATMRQLAGLIRAALHGPEGKAAFTGTGF